MFVGRKINVVSTSIQSSLVESRSWDISIIQGILLNFGWRSWWRDYQNVFKAVEKLEDKE